MIQQPPVKQFQILKNRQTWTETTAVVSFSIPVEKLRKRLNSVFSAPLDLSDYYFSALVDCNGMLNGNTLKIEYVKYAKGSIRYYLTGQVFGDPSGSGIKLNIRAGNLLRGYIFTAAIGLILPVLIGRGIVSLPGLMLGGVLLAAFLILIYSIADLVRRRSVLENVCRVLQKYIEESNHD